MKVFELEAVRDTIEQLCSYVSDDTVVDVDVDAALKLLDEEIENAAKEEGATDQVEATGADSPGEDSGSTTA